MGAAHACEITEVAWPQDIAAAAATWSARGELAWLDSCTEVIRPLGLAPGAHSLLAAEPIAILEQFDGRPARLRTPAGHVLDEHASGWTLWRRCHARLPRLATPAARFAPGWIGYVGFEMARQLERLPASHRDDLGLPLLRLALFDRVIVLDHQTGRAWAVTAPALRDLVETGPSPSDWQQRWAAAVHAASDGGDRPAPPSPRLSPPTPRRTHARAVRQAIEHIAAGDIYQVNLAHRLRIRGIGPPLRAYARLRQINPAPYAAFLGWNPDVAPRNRAAESGPIGPEPAAPAAILSVSPELFLEVRGDGVRTSPIKGTRPRTGNPVRDEQYRRELLASAKEAAELAMIVDLHRNDLGRVCRPGTVRVAQARRIEVHPTVFHTVADVTGRLRPEHDAFDLLMAAFPAGSISGVPKIRALEIIDELESCARGAYTGGIGHLGLDGNLTMSVAIRTVQVRGTVAALHVGGGIVADSDPDAEYDETLAKARGILRGLGVAPTAATSGEPPRLIDARSD